MPREHITDVPRFRDKFRGREPQQPRTLECLGPMKRRKQKYVADGRTFGVISDPVTCIDIRQHNSRVLITRGLRSRECGAQPGIGLTAAQQPVCLPIPEGGVERDAEQQDTGEQGLDASLGKSFHHEAREQHWSEQHRRRTEHGEAQLKLHEG